MIPTAIPTARPIIRCPQCGTGWMTARALQAEELGTCAIHCLSCGWDMEDIGGQWVSVTRPPDATTPRALARPGQRGVL